MVKTRISMDRGGIDNLRRSIDNVLKGEDDLERLDARKVASTMAQGLQESYLQAGLPKGGDLYNIIDPSNIQERKSQRGTTFVIPLHQARNPHTGYNYAAALEEMEPHWVTVSREHPELMQWAQRNGIEAGAIKVGPHPFIRRGIKQSYRKLRGRIEKDLPSMERIQDIFDRV